MGWTAPILLALLLAGRPIDEARLKAAATAGDWEQVRALGPGVLPALARLYLASPEEQRVHIAYVFYQLGWKSAEATSALMKDIHTQNQSLRLQVQWALGRISDDPVVVDALLENMRNDAVPLFRDKAACALAYDQIHLSPAQRGRLFEGLIDALEDPKPQVRQIALQALQILTGQTKGFEPAGPPESRRHAVEQWQRWLEDFRASL